MTSQRGLPDDDAGEASRRHDDATSKSLVRGCLTAAGVIAIGLLVLVLVAVGLLVGLCGFGR